LTSSNSTLQLLNQDIEAVERLMISQSDEYNDDLKYALELLLSSGGKRIRPRIILLLGNILKGQKDLLITLAASIELLHTATLVHDDLIDGALLRRGVPTLNSKWTAAATVLTGDFIFSSAAFLAAKTDSIEVMRIFSRTLMTIVNGEVNQLFGSRCNPTKDDYYKRIYAKTASLFETSTHTAAILSQTSSEQTEKMRRFGYELGMAFQIVDDVLDYSGSESEVGKPVGGDLRQGLITLPMLYYIETNFDNKIVKDILNGNCIKDDQEIDHLIYEIVNSPAIEKSLKEAEGFCERALVLLSELPDCPEKIELVKLTESSVLRRK